MVFVKGGYYTPLFKYGENNLDCKIIVNSFYIHKYPVTNADYKLFLDINPEWNNNIIKEIFADNGYLHHWSNESFNLIENKPVVNVSWFAANAYCESLNLKLPSIDQWEYLSSVIDNKDIINWYKSKDEKLPDINDTIINTLGLACFNTIIWEWVFDFNSVILINSDTEGGGLEEILYCGATATNALDPADYLAFMRYAFRNSLEGNYTMNKLGFRCVKNV